MIEEKEYLALRHSIQLEKLEKRVKKLEEMINNGKA